MCKICGFETKDIFINKQLYEKCLNCGYLAKRENNYVSKEEEYKRYLLHDNNLNNDYIEYQTKFFLEIKEFLGELNLDYGAGNMHILANILNEHGYKTNYYDLFFYDDESYKNNEYDSIILEEVIEHLKNPMEVLRSLMKLLKPNGRIIIRTNFIVDNLNNWWYLRDITHIGFFDVKTFNYICDILGLEIIYCNEKHLIILKG